MQVAEEEAQKRAKPLRMKKLYVLAAFLVEEHNAHKQTLMGSVGELIFRLVFWDEVL